MDDLPLPLILEILNRLDDSSELARCRLVSKTLNALSREVRSINLQCSFERYAKSRSPQTRSLITPFKTIFKTLISASRNIDSVTLGVQTPLREVSYDDVEDEDDDLYLTDINFINEWLPGVSGRLRLISISDFWIQSCWRRSEVLSLLSSHCHSLLELEVKNAWLSVDGLNPMPMLTSLTLEYIRLDDENLNKLNDCFPSLQVLNLIGVGGLKEPRIHLLHLKTCQWTTSNAPLSVTIFAPNLIKLKLKCVKPRELVLETPLLSDFYLSLQKATDFKVKDFCNLKTLRLGSTDLCNLFRKFPRGRTIKDLTVDAPERAESVETTKFSLEELFKIFPNVSSFTLGPAAWSELATCSCQEGLKLGHQKIALKEITAYVKIEDIEITLSFLSFVLEKCTSLSDVALLIHRDIDSNVGSNFISRCMAHCSRVRWRWGTWKSGMEDAWIAHGI